LSASGATASLCDLIARCGPYGAGNPEPLFAFPALRVVNASIVGEHHVRCVFASGDGGRIAGIAFRAAQSELGALLLNTKGRPVHVAATLKTDEWQGNVRVQATVRDAAWAS
jgi:single-stranded-DNA-specific exonuclease